MKLAIEELKIKFFIAGTSLLKGSLYQGFSVIYFKVGQGSCRIWCSQEWV
jgi:hypothetical protein